MPNNMYLLDLYWIYCTYCWLVLDLASIDCLRDVPQFVRPVQFQFFTHVLFKRTDDMDILTCVHHPPKQVLYHLSRRIKPGGYLIISLCPSSCKILLRRWLLFLFLMQVFFLVFGLSKPGWFFLILIFFSVEKIICDAFIAALEKNAFPFIKNSFSI